jgi:hypothetical protein
LSFPELFWKKSFEVLKGAGLGGQQQAGKFGKGFEVVETGYEGYL